jgi:hypothetical protein
MVDDLALERQRQRQEISDLRASYYGGLGCSKRYIVPLTPMGNTETPSNAHNVLKQEGREPETPKPNGDLVRIIQKGHAMKDEEGTLLPMKYPRGLRYIRLEDKRIYPLWGKEAYETA